MMTDDDQVRLHPINDWVVGTNCSVTALCAVTGSPIPVVESSLAHRGFDLRWLEAGVPPSIWSGVLTDFGISFRLLFDSNPNLTINTFMNRVLRGPGYLDDEVFLIATRGQKVGHVFAATRENVVDYYTGGRIEPFISADRGLDDQILRYVLDLTKSP
jgi:hypothetical protein